MYEFIIPDFDLQIEVPNLNREIFTTRALITNIINSGYENIINTVLPNNFRDLDDITLITILSDSINQSINDYLEDPSDDLLTNIFHSIQIWGGNSARMFYFNQGVEVNFDLNGYKTGVNFLRAGDVNQAINSFRDNIRQMNIAYASKHFSFWTNDFQGIDIHGQKQLPILDRLINNLVYGNNNQPTYQNYLQYVNDMYIAVDNIDFPITVFSLERQLFNFADTLEGRKWIHNRLNN